MPGGSLGIQRKDPLKNESRRDRGHRAISFAVSKADILVMKMLKRITVHKECVGLAKYINCRNLSDIYYEDVDYYEQLTADDIEAIMDDYFMHSEEIVRGFYRNEYLSDELLAEYDLEYLGMGRANDSYTEYTFPEKPVHDRAQLIRHVEKESLKDLVIVFTEKVERSVQKGQQKK